MRHIFVITIALSLLGCATTAPDGEAAATPEIRIEQLPRSEFDIEQRGAVSIAYQMVVRNRSTEPITLREVTMKTVGRSPYALRNTPVSLNETVEPGGEATVTFSMWSDPREGRPATPQQVWVRGTARFKTATAEFATTFSQSFREPD